MVSEAFNILNQNRGVVFANDILDLNDKKYEIIVNEVNEDFKSYLLDVLSQVDKNGNRYIIDIYTGIDNFRKNVDTIIDPKTGGEIFVLKSNGKLYEPDEHGKFFIVVVGNNGKILIERLLSEVKNKSKEENILDSNNNNQLARYYNMLDDYNVNRYRNTIEWNDVVDNNSIVMYNKMLDGNNIFSEIPNISKHTGIDGDFLMENIEALRLLIRELDIKNAKHFKKIDNKFREAGQKLEDVLKYINDKITGLETRFDEYEQNQGVRYVKPEEDESKSARANIQLAEEIKNNAKKQAKIYIKSNKILPFYKKTGIKLTEDGKDLIQDWKTAFTVPDFYNSVFNQTNANIQNNILLYEEAKERQKSILNKENYSVIDEESVQIEEFIMQKLAKIIEEDNDFLYIITIKNKFN